MSVEGPKASAHFMSSFTPVSSFQIVAMDYWICPVNLAYFYFCFTGQGVDEPLSETGFKQANAAGVFLSNVKFTHVFASDLLRAKQVSLFMEMKITESSAVLEFDFGY